jgi:hypothetical protein
MDGLSGALSMPYAFPHEDAFALAVGVLILGLLWLRFALARRRQREDSPGR